MPTQIAAVVLRTAYSTKTRALLEALGLQLEPIKDNSPKHYQLHPFSLGIRFELCRATTDHPVDSLTIEVESLAHALTVCTEHGIEPRLPMVRGARESYTSIIDFDGRHITLIERRR